MDIKRATIGMHPEEMVETEEQIEKRTDRYIELYEAFEDQKSRADNLKFLIDELEAHGIAPDSFEDLLGWIDSKIEEGKLKNQYVDSDGNVRNSMIHSDEPIRYQEVRDYITDVIMRTAIAHGDGHWIPIILEKFHEREQLTDIDNCDMLLRFVQIEMEKVRLLIVRDKPLWSVAADLAMKIYYCMHNTVIHDIRTHIKPGVEDPDYQDIDQWINPTDLHPIRLNRGEGRAVVDLSEENRKHE